MLFKYGYGGKLSVVDRRENKQRNFAESETRHFVRSHDKNAENVIFRICDEGISILGERYNAGNNYRSKEKKGRPVCSMDDIKSVSGLSVNDLNQLVKVL